MSIRPIWFVPALLVLACSGWDRSNPLDPRNPDTGGRITDVRLSAIKHDVIVSWDSVDLPGVIGYQVYRKRANETSFLPVGSVSATVSSYMDSGRPYEENVQYAVTAVTSAPYESPLSDSLSILPGPYTFWMLDYYDGSVQRLTYDGRHAITLMRETIWPTAVAVDTSRHQIWMVDWVTGYLYRMNETGEIDLWISGLDNPTLVACDPIRQEICVVNADRTQLVYYSDSGEKIGTGDGFGYITGLCWSGQSGRFWVADQDLRQVRLMERSGLVVSACSLSHNWPPILDCHPDENWALLADSLALVRLYPDGQIDSMTVLDMTVYDISIDRETGGSWLLLNGPAGADEVVYVRADGELTVRTEGYYSALAVAAVPGQKGCLVADTGQGRIVRLHPNGEILGERTGLVSPWDVILY